MAATFLTMAEELLLSDAFRTSRRHAVPALKGPPAGISWVVLPVAVAEVVEAVTLEASAAMAGVETPRVRAETTTGRRAAESRRRSMRVLAGSDGQ
jgi:hypothetical protein